MERYTGKYRHQNSGVHIKKNLKHFTHISVLQESSYTNKHISKQNIITCSNTQVLNHKNIFILNISGVLFCAVLMTCFLLEHLLVQLFFFTNQHFDSPQLVKHSFVTCLKLSGLQKIHFGFIIFM